MNESEKHIIHSPLFPDHKIYSHYSPNAVIYSMSIQCHVPVIHTNHSISQCRMHNKATMRSFSFQGGWFYSRMILQTNKTFHPHQSCILQFISPYKQNIPSPSRSCTLQFISPNRTFHLRQRVAPFSLFLQKTRTFHLRQRVVPFSLFLQTNKTFHPHRSVVPLFVSPSNRTFHPRWSAAPFCFIF